MTSNIDGNDTQRFRILVCLDGSDESYRGLRYAAKLGKGVDADIILLYIRSVDPSLNTEKVSDQPKAGSLLSWGNEVPGVNYLKDGRDLLVELGILSMDWSVETGHDSVEGDSVGDTKVTYESAQGKQVVLKLKVAENIANGILEQTKINDYNLVILGAAHTWRESNLTGFWDKSLSEKVVTEAPCSVLVARDLEIGQGHLICTDGSDKSTAMVRHDAVLANRCECPVSIISVAFDEAKKTEAQHHAENAKAMLAEMGIVVQHTLTPVGDPVREIVEAGPDYSLIVLSDTSRTGLQRLIVGSVSIKILKEAHNSVMVVR